MHRHRLARSRSCCWFAVALTACGPSFDALDGGVAGTSSGADSSDGSRADNDDEPPHHDPNVDEGMDGGVADDGPDSPGFIQSPDGGSVNIECDVWAQDCPAGEKCAWWANDGGNAWNATKCVPIVPDPDELGEQCTVVGSGVSGVDSCVAAAICWNVDTDTNLGTCVSFCMGSEANPTCPDPNTHCVGRTPMLCVPQCCPLEQDCSDGQGCYPANEAFLCAPDAGGDQGAFGDGCEFINVCDPGLFCAGHDQVPNCAGSIGCCTDYCLVGSPQCAAEHPGMDCVPWFEEGQGPPGFEHTGGCFIPS